MSSFQDLRKKRDARSIAATLRAAKRPEVASLRHTTPSTAFESQQDPSPASHGSPQQSTIDAGEAQTFELNADIAVRSVPGRGRGLFWAPADGRLVQPGKTLFKHRPEVCVLSSGEIDNRCSACFKRPENGLLRCSGCRIAHYCDDQCQRRAWSSHRSECSALRNYGRQKQISSFKDAVGAPKPGTNVRLAARVIRMLSDTANAADTRRLEGLRGEGRSSTNELELLKGFLGATPDSGSSNTDLVHRAADIVRTNSFAMTSHELDTVGAMVSTYAALLNHTCDANACIVWPEGVESDVDSKSHPAASFSVVARTAIRPGDEITTFYLDPSTPYKMRQLTLERQYGFRCSCKECVRAMTAQSKPSGALMKARELDPRSVVWCPEADCRGWVRLASPNQSALQPRSEAAAEEDFINRERCSKCKKIGRFDLRTYWSKIALATETLKRMEKAVDKLESSTMTSKTRFDAELDAIATICPPSAFPRFAMLQQALTLSLAAISAAKTIREAADTTDDAIRTGLLLIAGMQAGEKDGEKARPGIMLRDHPYRGMTLANVGCALATSCNPAWQQKDTSSTASATSKGEVQLPPRGPQRSAMTAAILARAYEELQIAFGSESGGSIVGRRVKDMLTSAVVSR